MRKRYLLRRSLQSLLVLWIVATAVFFLFRILPGDATSMILGFEATQEARMALAEQLGLNDPLLVQYARWLGDLVTGDLGTSLIHGGLPVAGIVFPALAKSLELAALATVLAITIAVPLGMLSATRAGSWVDSLVRVGTTLGFSMPTFVLGIMLLLLFAETIPIFPPGGYVPFLQDPMGHLSYLALPVVTVGVVMAARLTRFMRASMIEELGTDYARTALAKGLSQREVNYRHSFRNALIPVLTEVGVNFGLLIGGMVIVEQIFAWPGLGWLMIQSVFGRAFEVVQIAVLVAAALLVVINFLVDAAYLRIDPRISLVDKV